MSGTIVNLIIQLIAGAAGGNIAGSLLKQYNLGTLGNSIAGIVGGGLGGQLLGMLMGTGASGGGMDIGSLIAQVVGGGVGEPWQVSPGWPSRWSVTAISSSPASTAAWHISAIELRASHENSRECMW